jgi:hypothetical protein
MRDTKQQRERERKRERESTAMADEFCQSNSAESGKADADWSSHMEELV